MIKSIFTSNTQVVSVKSRDAESSPITWPQKTYFSQRFFFCGLKRNRPIWFDMENYEKMEKHVQYERVFSHFDDNGDGKISASELQQHCGGITLEEATAAVDSLDSDGDGLLELEDFVRLVEGVEEEEKINDLKEAFKMYEMDGSGCITPKSLKRMLSSLGESRSLDECGVMISQFDLNGDGVLSFDEFKVMMS